MTDPSQEFEALKAARAEVAQSPGALLSDELAGAARSYRLFEGNAHEFAAFLGRFDTDLTARAELWALKNRSGFEAFLDQVDRLLHNYLAAASTLRDHTRRLWRFNELLERSGFAPPRDTQTEQQLRGRHP